MKRRKIVEVFDLVAEDYDRWYEEHFNIYLTELEAVKAFSCGKALEIGVGTGRFIHGTGVVVGADPSLRMLRRVPKNISLVQAVGEMLPFRDRSFDCAFLIVTLCFVEDPEAVLREAARVAERVIVCIIPRESDWGRYYMKLAKEGHPIYSLAKFYSAQNVVEFASKVGLHLRRVLAALRYPPGGEEIIEEVREISLAEAGDYGFVCMEFYRGN